MGKQFKQHLLDMYIKEIEKYPRMSRVQELIVSKEAFNGCKKSKQQLIESNLFLVISIARKYFSFGYFLNTVDIMDIVQAGNVGLILAAQNHNPDISYFGYRAIRYISGHIKKLVYREPQHRRLDTVKRNEILENEILEDLIKDEHLLLLKRITKNLKMKLGNKELYILQSRVLADSPKTLTEIGDILKLSPQTINNTEDQLINKIKQIMKTMPEFKGEF